MSALIETKDLALAYHGKEVLRDVNLTGGEPFLREDFVELHAAVRTAWAVPEE